MSFRRFIVIAGALLLLLATPVHADPGVWVGKWFKVTIAFNRLRISSTGVRTDRQRGAAYGKIESWNPSGGQLVATFHFYAPDSQSWFARSADLTVFAGSDLDLFVLGTSATKLQEFGFTARLQGKQKGGALKSASLRSLGGYSWEIDDVPGSDERWIGSFGLSGKLIDESKVPAGART